MSANNVTVLYAVTIIAVNGIHSGGTVVSCLRGNRSCGYRVVGIRHHGSALNRVKDDAGKRRARCNQGHRDQDSFHSISPLFFSGVNSF